MAQFDNRLAQGGIAVDPAATFDEALRSYMLRVYNYMTGGVALTGIVAYAINQLSTTTNEAEAVGRVGRHLLTPFGAAIYNTPIIWVLIFAPLAFVFFLSFRIYKMSVASAQLSFWLFSAVMGASISTILLRYTGQSVAQTFFITAASFGALSTWGYVTKRDLSGWGTFLIMGVFGLILASLVNIGFAMVTGHPIEGMRFIISLLGVGIFAGLTAYDTQQIKDNFYSVAHNGELMAKSAIMGALNLYLDFINMFQYLLSLIGDRD